MQKRVIIYGGNGGLGSACVGFFKSKGFWVCSVGSNQSGDADANVIITNRHSLEDQYTEVRKGMKDVLCEGHLVDGIFCVAGGWAGGSCGSKSFIKNVDLVLKQSIWSSSIAAAIGAKYLKPGGSLILSGALPALGPTPSMAAYGMAKSAVHQLTRSLAAECSGLPTDSFVAAILPSILDTPMNRKWMPNADHSKWTPLADVAELFGDWLRGDNRPQSGSLVELKTINGHTTALPIQQA